MSYNIYLIQGYHLLKKKNLKLIYKVTIRVHFRYLIQSVAYTANWLYFN